MTTTTHRRGDFEFVVETTTMRPLPDEDRYEAKVTRMSRRLPNEQMSVVHAVWHVHWGATAKEAELKAVAEAEAHIQGQ